jgi:hypothetical protein
MKYQREKRGITRGNYRHSVMAGTGAGLQDLPEWVSYLAQASLRPFLEEICQILCVALCD